MRKEIVREIESEIDRLCLFLTLVRFLLGFWFVVQVVAGGGAGLPHRLI